MHYVVVIGLEEAGQPGCLTGGKEWPPFSIFSSLFSEFSLCVDLHCTYCFSFRVYREEEELTEKQWLIYFLL